MGLFSLIGGIIGGGKAKKASKKATQAMVDAYNRGIDVQNQQFETTRADFAPWRTTGTTALSQLGDLVGTNGADEQAAAIDQLKASPFYQRLFGQGQDAVLAAASATGGMRGGDTQRGLYDAGVDTLMDVYNRQLSSLGGVRLSRARGHQQPAVEQRGLVP